MKIVDNYNEWPDSSILPAQSNDTITPISSPSVSQNYPSTTQNNNSGWNSPSHIAFDAVKQRNEPKPLPWTSIVNGRWTVVVRLFH